MKNTETTIKKEEVAIPNAEIQKGIANHKKAATHFEAAAKSHLEAAMHHEGGNHEKAAKSTVEAHGYSCVAIEAQKEDVKNHVTQC